MNVVIIGLGMVGYGLFEQLKKDQSVLSLYGVMDHKEALLKSLDCKTFQSIDEIVLDKKVDIVVELIGGLHPATEYIKKALQHGKHVVTANKAVVSKYFQSIHQLAFDNNVIFRYEASVGGGIIILDPLESLSKLAHIELMFGIINGSTNYILSKVFNENMSIKQAIVIAEELGYLETGTTDDMDGLDLVRKINIMSMLAYHGVYQEDNVVRMPLSSLSENMINYAKKQNKVIKYLAFSIRNKMIFVAPFLLPKSTTLSTIHDATNQICIYSKTSDWLVFEGQGAGRYPTSTAVLYDLYKVLEQKSYAINMNEQLNFKQNINVFKLVVETKDGQIKEYEKEQASSAIEHPNTKTYMFIWEDLI